MGYWYSVADKFILVVTVYAALFLYSLPIQRRKKKLPWFAVCAAAVAGLCFLLEGTRNLTAGHNLVSIVVKNFSEICLVVATSLSTLLVKKYSKGNFFFVCVAAYATVYLAENLCTLAFSLLFGPFGLFHGAPQATEYTVCILGIIAIYCLTFTVCRLVFIKKRGKDTEYLADRSVLVVFCLMFLVNLFIGDLSDITRSTFLFIDRILASVLSLFVLYNHSEYLNSREENMRLQVILQQQEAQYESSKEIIEKLNVKAHDLKHFVEIFKSRNDIPEEALTDLDNIGTAYDNLYRTGNKALDITLTEKCATFAKENIEFTVLADGSLISFMSDADIYVLFGNILENAKEAVRRESEEDRVIGLYLKKTDAFLSLHVENVCTEKNRPQFAGGLPVTVKEDKSNHGFGTKSIKHIVEKYGGTLRFGYENETFVLDAAFFTA